VMNPKLGALIQVVREALPIYKLNPSFFANRTEKCL
jgi:hypothetical protein